MDIKIKDEKIDFKFRVAGCLLVDDYILTVQICNNGFYCLPGGHLHLGEDSPSAIKREFLEETKLNCTVKDMFAIIENFFKNKDNHIVHEICLFYLLQCNNLKIKDFNLVENDDNVMKNLEFKWFKLSELDKVDFRPSALKEKLMKNDFSFSHIILNQCNKK